MKKSKIAASLALAVAVTSLSAFAAELPSGNPDTAVAAPASLVCTVAADTLHPGKNGDLTFTVIPVSPDGTSQDLLVDENGKQYVLAEDGTRIYITLSDSARLEAGNALFTLVPAE